MKIVTVFHFVCEVAFSVCNPAVNRGLVVITWLVTHKKVLSVEGEVKVARQIENGK
jgi:hypothetical protein